MVGRLIKVTVRDIANGKPRRAGKCAVALAVRRAFKKSTKVGDGYHITVGGKRYHSAQPKRTTAGIDRFDSNEPVRPFKFILKEGQTRY